MQEGAHEAEARFELSCFTRGGADRQPAAAVSRGLQNTPDPLSIPLAAVLPQKLQGIFSNMRLLSALQKKAQVIIRVFLQYSPAFHHLHSNF